MHALSTTVSKILRAYYLSEGHPSKLRIWRYLRKLQGYSRLTVPYIDVGWISLDERDHIQHSIFVNGAYEPEVWEALSSLAEDGEVIWDVGANIGSFALRA